MNPQLQNMLMQDGIIVQQDMEMTNVLLNIDSANNYNVYGVTGHKLGTVSEESGGAGGFLLRQILNSSRGCKLNFFDNQGQKIGEANKPFRFIFSEMSASYGNTEVGRAKRVSLFTRNYTIY